MQTFINILAVTGFIISFCLAIALGIYIKNPDANN